MGKRIILPVFLTCLLLLSGCGRAQITDGVSFSATVTEPDGLSGEFAAQTETTAELQNRTTDAETQTENAADFIETRTTLPVPTRQAAAQTTAATAKLTTTQTYTMKTTTAVSEQDSAYAFTAQYFRTNGRSGDAHYPQCFCVDSASALGAYVKQAEKQYSLTGSGFLEAVRQYDDAWFASHTLLIAALEENSGSVRHTVTRVEKTAPHAGTVEIKRSVPEVGTCDMAYWHILIEIPAGVFGAADAIEVVMK